MQVKRFAGHINLSHPQPEVVKACCYAAKIQDKFLLGYFTSTGRWGICLAEHTDYDSGRDIELWGVNQLLKDEIHSPFQKLCICLLYTENVVAINLWSLQKTPQRALGTPELQALRRFITQHPEIEAQNLSPKSVGGKIAQNIAECGLLLAQKPNNPRVFEEAIPSLVKKGLSYFSIKP